MLGEQHHPEHFWNVFVLARWIVFASGAFLLASRCFRFNLIGSSIFVLTFVFALFHARWINHPFLNGMAAGVWYLYFTLTTLDTSRYKRALRNHIGLLWGLTISTYSVVTCGFPEEKEYQLELRYWPPWLTASLIISLMGMTTLIVLTVLGRRRL